jgi:hypothetical protein
MGASGKIGEIFQIILMISIIPRQALKLSKNLPWPPPPPQKTLNAHGRKMLYFIAF